MRETIEALREQARRAVQWTSFDPEERGEQLLRTADKTLESFLSKIPEEVWDYYEKRFCEKLEDWYRAKSRCASAMIVGRSSYDIKKQRKMQEWADNALKRLEDWMEKVIKRANAVKRPVGWAKVEMLRDRLESQTEYHSKMIDANVIIRSYKRRMSIDEMRKSDDLRSDLEAAGLNEGMIRGALCQRDDGTYYSYGAGFSSYTITNARKCKEDTEYKLKFAESMAGREDRTVEAGTCKVELCYSEERVRIIYESKPDSGTINRLKQGAFRWSPKNKAWQRQITRSALVAVSEITKIEYEQLK